MVQLMLKKSLLASAICISFVSMNTEAAPAQLLITNLAFDGTIYNVGGQFNSEKTISQFDPATDLIFVPGAGRELAPGFDPLAGSGNIYSFDNFFGAPWEAIQQTDYLTNNDSWANCTDQCVTGSNKSSGPVSAQGQYDYDVSLANMSDGQIGIGMFFQWNAFSEISILEIFTCDTNDNCKGNGVKIGNGPFYSSVPIFNAGLTCEDGFVVTGVGIAAILDIQADVLDPCKNPIAANPTDPADLTVDSVTSPTSNGGTAISDGTVITYTPVAGFEGPDSFTISISDDTVDATEVTYVVQVGGQLQNNFTMLDVNGGIIGGTNDVIIVWDEVSFSDPATIPGSDNGDGFGIPSDTTPVMSISSPTPFRGFNWFAKNVRVYQGPIQLKFDIACTEQDYINRTTDCSASPLPPINIGERYIKMELKAGEIGAHMIFDWGGNLSSSTCGLRNCDIDVVNIWHKNEVWSDDVRGDGRNELYTGVAGVPPMFDTYWHLVSVAATPGAVIGTPMIDGGFKGSYANFNYKPVIVYLPPPPPTRVTDTGGAIGIIGFSLFTILAVVRRKLKNHHFSA